jgi:hypothetical protein
VANWWLAKRLHANTPNWDLASTACIEEEKGLLLVEAKAHVAELSDDRCGARNRENFNRIGEAIGQAATEWGELVQAPTGFQLGADSHYQLSNRFAFAWKLASMGIPILLVYLGFVDAVEMTSRKQLRDHEHWQRTVLACAHGVVPDEVWGKAFRVGRTPLKVMLASAKVAVDATSANVFTAE